MTSDSRQKPFIKRWWRLLIILFTPIVLLPFPIIVQTIQARCAYVVILLIIYWVSESMPYAVTSLLPLSFFPLAGIIPSDQVCLNYFKDITTLLVGSMILAHALEHVRLHRRLALLVLNVVGSSIKWSMAGLMLVTAFLSMWINNSAAASVMIPAATAIINEIQLHEQEIQERSAGHRHANRRKSKDIVPLESTVMFDMETSTEERRMTLTTIQETVPIDADGQVDFVQHKRFSVISVPPPPANRLDYHQLKTSFLIAVAYSAGIGGLATLVGSGPNIFVKGFVDDFYTKGPNAFEISFINFLLFALPIGVIMLVLCWLLLQVVYNRKELLPWIKKDAKTIESQKHLLAVFKEQYKELGGLVWKEYTIVILFILMVLLWITRDFSTYPGWAVVFRKGYISDGTVAILLGTLPLILPDTNPFSENWNYHPILQWNQLSTTFPWGVFMLQGAGLAIAEGFKRSDLSAAIASFLQFIVGASELTVIFVVILLSAIFTEFTSNLACASILFPILDSISHTTGIHPGRLILPSCMGVSLAFMLPIATPPNAMIFSGGSVRIIDMIKVGLVIKLIGIVIILFASMFLVSPIFHIHPIMPLLNETFSLNISIGR